jgi:Mlc titration factor MtfA (ptsG expression regulator)
MRRYARYISLHPEKADDFLAIFHAEWAKMFQDLPAQFRSPEIDAEISSHVSKYAAGKRVSLQDLKWSDVQVADMAREAGPLAELHPLAFTSASAYIHPGAQFLVSQMSMTPDGVLHIDQEPRDAESAFALRGTHDLLLNAVDLRLKYAPSSELSSFFQICKTDFKRIWGYEPHL